MILNVPNRGCIEGLGFEDVVEVPCMVDQSGPRALPIGPRPEGVRGLVFALKQYERLAINAAVERQWETAIFALMTNPIVGSWSTAEEFMDRLLKIDKDSFTSFKSHDILRSAPH